MTRKEELEARARQFMETQDRYPYLTAIDLLYKELLQVEREVWEQVAKHLEGEAVKSRDFENKLMRKGNADAASDIQTQRITEEVYAAWARAQQQELT